MSHLLVIMSGLMYAAIAVDQGLKFNWPLLIIYACYALSNVGVYMLVK
jgi:hypothetical protein